MGQIVVYTCIVGGYDRLIQQPQEAGVRYVCFTDTAPTRTAGWEIRPFISPAEIQSARLVNRYHKMLCYDSFEGATESIYVDGNVVLLAPPSILVNRLRESRCSVAALPHAVRKTVAEEMRACERKLSASQVEAARGLYDMQVRQGFPDTLGLSANYLLVRSTKDQALRRSMMRWWDCVSSHVERDQLSLQYCLWAEGVSMLMLDGDHPGDRIARRLRHGASGLSILERLGIWGRSRLSRPSADQVRHP
jgi:hypothetical protein